MRALEPASTVSVRLVPETSFLTVSCSIRVSPFTCAHPEAFAPGETLISNNLSTVIRQVGANVKLNRQKTAMMTCTLSLRSREPESQIFFREERAAVRFRNRIGWRPLGQGEDFSRDPSDALFPRILLVRRYDHGRKEL
jgi:hypothetical protein